MAIRRKQNILGFQISVDDVVAVYILYCEGDFRTIKACHWFREAPQTTEMKKKLAAGTIVQHEKQHVVVLEGVPKLADKRVVHLGQDFPLGARASDMPRLATTCLYKCFQCAQIASHVVANKQDFAERPFSNYS